MSILIEALSLVVPRRVLDVSWPDGADGWFCHAYLSDDVRHAVMDDHLACVSALDPEPLLALVEELKELGVVVSDDGRAYDLVMVDQETGPVLPADWLVVERHAHGFTRAWHAAGMWADGEPGELDTPRDWRLEHSWRLIRHDVRDGNDDWLRLSADDDGLETWIDFSTGQMNQALPEMPRVVTVEPSSGRTTVEPPALGRAVADLREVLQSRGIPYRIDLEHGCVIIPFATEAVDRVQVVATPIRHGEALRCSAVLPDLIDPDVVPAVQRLATQLVDAGSPSLIEIDLATRTVQVVTRVSAAAAGDPLGHMERMIAFAADQASRIGDAIVMLLIGVEPSVEWADGIARHRPAAGPGTAT